MSNPNLTTFPLINVEWESQHAKLHSLICQVDELAVVTAQNGGQLSPDLETRLLELLGDIMTAMFEHFLWEEKLMRSLPSKPNIQSHCDSHKLDHANVSEKLSQLISTQSEQTPGHLLATLQELLKHWYTTHEREHDLPLARWLAESTP